MDIAHSFSWLKRNWNKFFIVILSVIVISGTFTISLDQKGEQLVDDSMKQAIQVFAIAKGLNAAISLAQGTELDPPGITITIGEVLDPINDLVEQFSWVMLASITSLGIQKILLNGVVGDLFNTLLVVCIITLNVWLFIRFKNDTKIRNLFFKITIILVFLRFGIPIMSLANHYVYENYVASNYNIEIKAKEIKSSANEINTITNNTISDKEQLDKSMQKEIPTGFFNTLSNELDDIKSFFSNFYSKVFSMEYYEQKLDEYKDATEKTSEYILDLIIAFVFNTLFFPLLFLFLLYQLLRNIFNIGR
jgi:hypothetical protein